MTPATVAWALSLRDVGSTDGDSSLGRMAGGLGGQAQGRSHAQSSHHTHAQTHSDTNTGLHRKHSQSPVSPCTQDNTEKPVLEPSVPAQSRAYPCVYAMCKHMCTHRPTHTSYEKREPHLICSGYVSIGVCVRGAVCGAIVGPGLITLSGEGNYCWDASPSLAHRALGSAEPQAWPLRFWGLGGWREALRGIGAVQASGGSTDGASEKGDRGPKPASTSKACSPLVRPPRTSPSKTSPVTNSLTPSLSLAHSLPGMQVSTAGRPT